MLLSLAMYSSYHERPYGGRRQMLLGVIKGLVNNYGEGGLYNAKIADPKLFAPPPPKDSVTLFAPPPPFFF